jgi:type I restriction enzyme R subunit
MLEIDRNGVMNSGLLYEPPFTEIHHKGLDGLFEEANADLLVSLVGSFNETVDRPFRKIA